MTSRRRRVELPQIYWAADNESVRAEVGAVRWVRIRLAALLMLAVGSFVAERAELAGNVTVAAGISLSLASTLWLAVRRYDGDWHGYRAVAESIKSACIRYQMVPVRQAEESTPDDDGLIRQIELIFDSMSMVSPLSSDSPYITDSMRRLASSDFETRRSAYRVDRVQDQAAWYNAKSIQNRRLYRRLSGITVIVEITVLIAVVLALGGLFSINMYGVVATFSAGVMTWQHFRQYRRLSTTYAQAARDLSSFLTRIDSVEPAAWEGFVDDAERSISREHRLWLASHHAGL